MEGEATRPGEAADYRFRDLHERSRIDSRGVGGVAALRVRAHALSQGELALMTLLPNQIGQPPGIGAAAPGREIHRVVRKRLPDGRVREFLWRLETHVTPDMTYVTWDLVEAPALDCPCTPLEPDDVTCCTCCRALVCVRRHSATCAACGKVFGSCCLKGITLQGVPAIVCKACADELTSSMIVKVFKGIRSLVWGGSA